METIFPMAQLCRRTRAMVSTWFPFFFSLSCSRIDQFILECKCIICKADHHTFCSNAKEQSSDWITQICFTGLQKKIIYISSVIQGCLKTIQNEGIFVIFWKQPLQMYVPHYIHIVLTSHQRTMTMRTYLAIIICYLGLGMALGVFASRALVSPGKMIVIMLRGLGLLFQNGYSTIEMNWADRIWMFFIKRIKMRMLGILK